MIISGRSLLFFKAFFNVLDGRSERVPVAEMPDRLLRQRRHHPLQPRRQGRQRVEG